MLEEHGKEVLYKMLAQMTYRYVKQGSNVCKKGQFMRFMFIIIKGQFVIKKITQNSKPPSQQKTMLTERIDEYSSSRSSSNQQSVVSTPN